MPLIRIEYDDAKLQDKAVAEVSNAVQQIVSKATGIKDVFVYANSSHIKVQVAPIEIFIEMSASKITDKDALFADIKSRIQTWKRETGFSTPINLTLIPMNWKFEVNL